MYKKNRVILNDQEKILLSRLYKLDRQIGAYMMHHKNISMNKLIPQTDFIKKANDLYRMMDKKLIDISLERTRYTHNLVDLHIIKNK